MTARMKTLSVNFKLGPKNSDARKISLSHTLGAEETASTVLLLFDSASRASIG